MHQILLVDDNQAQTLELQKSLQAMNPNWKVLTADDYNAAQEILKSVVVDILIADLCMPGMDSTDLLAQVRDDQPQCLRIAVTGETAYDICSQAVKVAHQCISRPYKPQDIAQKIYQVTGLSALIDREEIKGQINQISNLPSQPSSYTRLISELSRTDIDLEQVSAVISTDLAMTAKLLQLVNSAYFGLPREVYEVSQAIFYLGTDTIRDLALSIQIFSQFDQDKLQEAGLDTLWGHSIQVAQFSRAICSTITNDKITISSAFTAGMLHDVGKLILGSGFPKLYAEGRKMGLTRPEEFLALEKRELGSNHADIGAYLLGIWGIPPGIVIAVSNHHAIGKYLNRGFASSVASYFGNYFSHSFNTPTGAPAPELEPYVGENLWVKSFQTIWKNQCARFLN